MIGRSGAGVAHRVVGAVRILMVVLAVHACVAADDVAGQLEEWRTDFTRHTVDLGEIVSGGPPKDGIPAIDAPKFTSVGDAERYIDDAEPVAVVRIGGVTKAYPIQILIWHEIANDVIGGVPVSVTYCPLCNTTIAFDRRFEDRTLDFGTTGRLRHSDMIMYDRQTETWWQQATGEGIVGEHAGRRLTFVPAPVMRWADVKRQHPDALVLSRETGHPGYRTRYGRNPYRGYDRGSPIARFFRRESNPALPPMERVAALQLGDSFWAVPFSALREERLAHLSADGRDVVVFFQPETVSSVDGGMVMDGRAVGSSSAYEPVVDGRFLRFEPGDAPGEYRDVETGSLWNFSGAAVAGSLRGAVLRSVPVSDPFWFAWSVFRPDTQIWKPKG